MENLKLTKKEKILHWCIVLFIVLQPIIDLDYLFYDSLQQLGLPRPSTFVRLIILPILIVFSFYLHERNKKKTFLFALFYGVSLIAYYYMHMKRMPIVLDKMNLTPNFVYDPKRELTYYLTLVLPYGMIYLFYHEHFTKAQFQKMIVFTSVIITAPILLGDLFVFGQSTYKGNTVANIFSWFTPIYRWYSPQQLSSKFFFNLGNTLSVLMFILLPLLYLFYVEEENTRNKRLLLLQIYVHSLAMEIISTRVSAYGALIVPIFILVLYFIDIWLIKGHKFNKRIFINISAVLVLIGLILPYSPAIQNQKVFDQNTEGVKENKKAEEGKIEYQEHLNEPNEQMSDHDFYMYIFETYGIYGKYIQSMPTTYYTDYYNYKHDPKFWCDVMFMPVEQRMNGRQIEKILYQYKSQNLNQTDKMFGMGYTPYLNGSLALEKDFVLQRYSYGYIGAFLSSYIWIMIGCYGLFEFIKYHKKMMVFENLVLAMSFGISMFAAWFTGHVLDQYLATVYMALIVALLLNRIHESKVDV